MKFLLPAFSIFLICCALYGEGERPSGRPVLREFLGINVHYPFRPDLYRPVAKLVRNYHDMNWDVNAPGDPPTFPHCVNGVNWDEVYGRWNTAGFAISLCSQFVKFGKQHPDHRKLWEGREGWAREYGHAMARHLGPTRGNGLVNSIEIGNEPGSDFADSLYQKIFREMAAGIREGDPAIKIATCTVHVGEADEYHKSLDETFGNRALHPFFDVINLHTYAELPKEFQRHPWDRTFPEDPRSPFLKKIDDAVEWRDRNAPGKEIWVTEFGWDSCSEAAMSRRKDWFEKLNWQGVTDLQQAQYLVRSVLLFLSKPVDRAYLFWYNDQDEPSVHGASGLTRIFEPKPSFWALAQLQELLGDFRFSKVLSESGGKFVFQMKSDDGDEILAVWKSVSEDLYFEAKDLPDGKTITRIYPMQTSPEKVQPLQKGDKIELSESVTYLVLGEGVGRR